MTDLPSVNAARLIRAPQRAGFFVHHTTGSHYVLKHPDRLQSALSCRFTEAPM